MKIPEKSLPTGEFRSLCCLNGFPKREHYRITYISVPDVTNPWPSCSVQSNLPFRKKNPFLLRAVFWVPKIVNSIDPYLG